MRKTTGLSIKFLGIVPRYEASNAVLSPQETAAFSGLLTFKGSSLPALIKEAKEKKQDINKKVSAILNKSSLKGHASMATMPVVCFSFEGSKMVGAMLTGMTFSSALMHSGRRARVTLSDVVYPTKIANNKRALKEYRDASKALIDGFDRLIALGTPHDEASKLLHYGTYGTGIITMPIESIVTFAREYEIAKEWMPEEAALFLGKLKGEFKKMGVDLLYATRMVAPRNPYPYPNTFKNPKESNLVRELVSKTGFSGETMVIGVDNHTGKDFKRRALNLKKLIISLGRDKEQLRRRWPELLQQRRAFIRDFSGGINVKVLSRVSWRIWRDKKRHRTAPVTTESIYYCVNRAVLAFQKRSKEIKKKFLSSKVLAQLDQVLAIPPFIAKHAEAKSIFMESALASLEAYDRLIKLGIREADAVFIIPRAIRVDMVQDYNLYNLIDGYYQLRSCPTADEQIFRQSKEEIRQLEAAFQKLGIGFLHWFLEPKCAAAGFCPEEKTCGYIKKIVPQYNEAFHEEMKVNLEKKFQEMLKK